MTNKEKNIINVLAALSNHSYNMYEIYKGAGERGKALKYLRESGAYYIAAQIITNEDELKSYAKIHNIELIK